MARYYLMVLILIFSGSELSAQGCIKGKIKADTSKWAPYVYLSLIPDFGQMNTISKEYIIHRAPISNDGSFEFSTIYLPDGDHLCRIHISKKGDPPASLIIGGKDHNHMFLIANNNSDIEISTTPGERLFNGLSFNGYSPNKSLLEIDQIIGLIDSLDQYGGDLNHDFIRNAIYEKLREYADTCDHIMVSIYALYRCNFQYDRMKNPDFYTTYINNRSSEESEYFLEFKKKFGFREGSNQLPYILIALGVTILITFLFIYRLKKNRRKNKLSKLTIQERKILELLKLGKSNQEIADEHSISISTVKTHINNIYAKLGINSRKETLDLE